MKQFFYLKMSEKYGNTKMPLKFTTSHPPVFQAPGLDLGDDGREVGDVYRPLNLVRRRDRRVVAPLLTHCSVVAKEFVQA